jgi:hypothetical protein
VKKKPSTAVSSWGFSGYITVLPKENKESKDTPNQPLKSHEHADGCQDKRQAASGSR